MSLCPLGNAASLHTLELPAHASLLNLALLLLLRVLEVTLVTEFHQVARLVDFALEAAKGAFDGFAVTNIDLDLHGEFRGRSDCKFRAERRIMLALPLLAMNISVHVLSLNFHVPKGCAGAKAFENTSAMAATRSVKRKKRK